MTRLIDADKLMADIERQPLGGWQKQTVRCVLNDQPTAYDVEAVLEELEARAVCYDSIFDCLGSWGKCEYCNDCAINRKEAIDTVKRGGKK